VLLPPPLLLLQGSASALVAAAAAAAASSGVSLRLARGVCRALLPAVTGMHELNMTPRSPQLPMAICSITCSSSMRQQNNAVALFGDMQRAAVHNSQCDTDRVSIQY
jgi:hypothetical protein